MQHLILCALCLLGILMLGQTLPSVPSTVSYKGRLTDGSDAPLPDGEYEMTFLVFDAVTGGNLLWSETQAGVMVAAGIYRAELGKEEPIVFSVFNSMNAFLEVRVFGETLGPRQRIVSVPFALKAEGEVPEGAIVLGEVSGDPAITGLGYTEQGDTIGQYYLYKKDAYNPSQSRVPRRIAYQGKVGPADGGTVGTAADFGFTIYDADTGGAAVWSETQDDVPVDASGLFSVELGINNPVDPVDLVKKDLWLAVSVNGQALSPREKLASAAYSLKVISPAPEGAIVLSSSTANQELISKKFTLIAGTTVDGYYPFRKSAFNPSNPAVPLLVNYQGKLTDVAGDTLSANTVDIGFRIYDGATAGGLLWSETVLDVGLSDGIFNALLGGGSTISPATFPGPDAWLQVTVIEGTTVETLSPRQRIASVPFAMSAEGMLPSSALILSSISDSDTLTSAGFQSTGDTVSGYYVYSKMEVDTTPPLLTIASPTPLQGFTVSPVPVTVTYSDALSGVDPSSFVALLNGVTVTGSFTLAGHTATGPLVPAVGYNILTVAVNDRADNRSETFSAFYSESVGDTTLPEILLISPPEHSTVPTNTPTIQLQISDLETGIWLYTINIDGYDCSRYFTLDGLTASWQVPGELFLPEGANIISVEATNHSNMTASVSFGFTVDSTGPNLTITSLSPEMGFVGDTVTITGTGFSTVPAENIVSFFSNQFATVTAATSTQLTVTVPPGALSGPLHVVVNQRATNGKDFVFGLKYGFVTNYNSPFVTDNHSTHKVTVIDFDQVSPGDSINQIRCGDRPYDVAVSPDGKLAYATDNTGNKVCIINTGIADSDSTAPVIKTLSLSVPKNIAVSPDGLEVYVGSDNGYFYTIRNQVVSDQSPLRLNLGGALKEIAVSPLHQLAYVLKNTGSTNNGEIHFINLNRAAEIAPWHNFTYFKPEGIALKPDQSEVYVANNRSDAHNVNEDQAYSFSVYQAADGVLIYALSAEIQPPSDAHDVNWPYDLVFDPRGYLLYASFSEGYSSTGVLGCSNNVGARVWPAHTGDFDAATQTDKTSPARGPHGLAISPGGDFVFSANYGIGSGSTAGNSIMIMDNSKIKAAIDGDPANSNYNLTGTNPESLESSLVPGNPGIVRKVGVYDGPRNIAFQQFPLIYVYPPVVHLALGGVKQGEDEFHWRVHPIYGDSVMVSAGTTTTLEKIIFPGAPASIERHWLSMNRYIFSAISGPVQSTNTLMPSLAGIGKVFMTSRGYPSNEIFVTVPPQNFIQGLYAEPLGNASELTIYCLAAVVRNQALFPRQIKINDDYHWFKWYASSNQYSPRVQITASNTDEDLVRKDMDCMVRYANFNSERDSSQWPTALTREGTVYKRKYDIAVKAAGDSMLDLLRTTADFPSSIAIGNTSDPQLYFKTATDNLQYPDYTKGALAFFSPASIHWNELIGDQMMSIMDAYTTDSTVFPNAGVPGDTIGFFHEKAAITFGSLVADNLVQVVIVEGVDIVNEQTRRPQFVFLRLRDPGWPSVIKVVP